MQALGQAEVVPDRLLLLPKDALLQHRDLKATDGRWGETLLAMELEPQPFREESVAGPDKSSLQGTAPQRDPPHHHHAFPNPDRWTDGLTNRQTCSGDSRTVWLKIVQFTV